ncbi:MAG TPA: LysR family transcriptional regulator [Kofleriaceae bacterium]|nr:LysR family transcriptional regulator [Kofleriaceae bacterium]
MQPAHDHLEVRHLRLVRAIGAEGSVTRAAGKLHLSQSAVSHQLLDLERDLSTKLFDRVGKRMVATTAGKRMMIAAERLLGELAELEREVIASSSARQPLRVTASCFTAYGWLPTALTRFAESHPQLDLDIVIEATRRPVEALVADEVDIAIVTEPPRDDTYQRAQIVESELVAVAHVKHPLCKRLQRGALRWGALRDCELLFHDLTDEHFTVLTTAVRESWRRESGERLTAPLVIRKIPLSEAILDLVRAGRSVAIVDRWTIEHKLGRSLRLMPIVPRAPRTFTAVWRRANPRGLPVKELLETMCATAAHHVATHR